MQMDILYLRRLNEGHLWFFYFKKIEIIENTDARVHTTSIIT